MGTSIIENSQNTEVRIIIHNVVASYTVKTEACVLGEISVPNTLLFLQCIYTVKKCCVSECPRGAIFSCFHGNPYCYHGNRKILLPWGVQLHHIFYSVFDFVCIE